tara:strand:- start:370 stop:594 length:225 start_codon:yes stop_codon:yes gene_type:complete
MEGYGDMENIKRIYVEDGKIIVIEGERSTKCNEAEIEGPSKIKNKDGNVWIETESTVVKLVHIPKENLKFFNEE